MTAVHWPDPVGDMWHGTFGNAPIHVGKPLAVLSDGTKHPL